MRGSRTATLAILLLAVLCFISLPVFSSENPWDADGGTGRGTTIDTTIVPNDSNGNAIALRAAANPGGSTGTDLFTGFLMTFSLKLANWFDIYENQVSTPVRVEASKVKRHHNYVQRNIQ